MTGGTESIIIDCSVVVKWELTAEPQSAEAKEILLDWQHKAIAVHVPHLSLLETASALLRAQRGGRVTESEAKSAVTALLGLPFALLEASAAIAARAFEIAA